MTVQYPSVVSVMGLLVGNILNLRSIGTLEIVDDRRGGGLRLLNPQIPIMKLIVGMLKIDEDSTGSLEGYQGH